MVPEDPYIDSGGEAEETAEESRERGGESRSGYSYSSPNTSPPTIVPGQSLLPSNNLRHIAIQGVRPNLDYALILITQKPTVGSGSGYDPVIFFEDVTGDGIYLDTPPTPDNYSVGVIGSAYTSASTLLSSADALQRNIKVHFSSGITRDFIVTIPGKRQSFEFFLGTTPNIPALFQGYTGSCEVSPGVNWTANYNSSTNTTVSTGSMYCQTWPISDPSNIYYSGDAAFDITSSQTLDFRINTEVAGSFINQAFADGFSRNSNSSFSGYGVPDQTNTNIQTVESYTVYLTEGYGELNFNPAYNIRESVTASLININRDNAGSTDPTFYQQIGFNHFKYNSFGDSPRWPFVHSITFSENLQSCADGQIIDACNNPNSLAYIGYNGFEDCSGVAISSAIYTNPNTTYTDSCCPDCNGLALTVTSEDPSTPSGTDGVIELSVDDGAGNGTGTANYTFVIEPLNSANAGKGAGTNIGSGAVSNITFTFGFQTDLAQDNLSTTANPTYATSSLTGNIPAVSSSGASTQGIEAGTYNVYVFDSNATAVCLANTVVTLTDPPQISGCTDSASLTYDSAANINNPGSCWYCTAATGLLENGNNTPVGANNGSIIQAGSSYTISSNALNTADTTVSININALPENNYWASVLELINGSGVLDGQTKIELYKWDTQTSSGNANFGTLTGFNAGTTIVGSAITQEVLTGGNFQTVLNNTTVGATFTYGYYSVKFYVNDPGGSSEVEECYAIMDVIIPVSACENNPGQGTAQDGSGGTVLITDSNLYVSDPALCLLINNFCCTASTFSLDSGSPTCSRTYTTAVTCTDNPLVVTAIIEYKNSSTSGIWTTTSIWNNLSLDTYGIGSWSFTESSLTNLFGNAEYRIKFVSYYSNANQCTHTSPSLNISAPVYGCTDPNGTTNYNPAAECDDGSCIYCVYGCTDNTMYNYDSSATCDDGSCNPYIYGCTDPVACNYDPAANTDDGSCIQCVYGCTDSGALNFDPLANSDDGSCFYCTNNEPIITFDVTPATVSTGCISNADGSFTATVNMPLCAGGSWSWAGAFFTDPTLYANGATSAVNGNLHAGPYSVTVTDCYGCTTTETVIITTDSSSCGCTDPAAENYCATCTVDDGTCLYCGCDDPNATNYNPNAFNTCSPNPCTYYLSPPPCIPSEIDSVLNKMKTCISVNGFEYYNKLVTGISDDCSIMNAWKLILIEYLMGRRGLPCIYNCADMGTPDASEVYKSCQDRWITGGPHTGLNDVAVTGTGVGTTSTAAMFTTLNTTSNLSTNGQLFNGDVIKHHTSGNIWIFNGPPITNGVPTGAVSVVGLDPETASGTLSGYWEYCSDSLRYTENTYNTNYLDNFTNFVNTFCADCGNQPTLLTGSRSNEDIPDIQQGIDGIDGLEI